MARIVWIDDNQSATALVGEVLEGLGHKVSIHDDLAPKLPNLRDVDLLVLDLFIEHVEDGKRAVKFGLNYLMRILDEDPRFRLAVERGDTRCLLLSQHLAEYDLRELIKVFTSRHDIRAFLRSKNQDADAYPSRREAIAGVIDDVSRIEVGPRLVDEIDRLLNAADQKDFFTMTLEDFRKQPEVTQAELQEQALAEAEKTAAAHFETHPDNDWLILSHGMTIVRSGAEGDMPSALERRSLAQSHGSPVLVMTREDVLPSRTPVSGVEEIFRRRKRSTATALQCEGVMHDYPVVTLKFDEVERTYHFDTGCDLNYLRASHVRELGHQFLIEDRVPRKSRFGRYFEYDLPAGGLDCFLVSADGDDVFVQVEGLAIEQFRHWHYARRCQENDCSVGSYGEPCAVRSGLLGRTFLGTNSLTIEIWPNAARTKVRQTSIPQQEP